MPNLHWRVYSSDIHGQKKQHNFYRSSCGLWQDIYFGHRMDRYIYNRDWMGPGGQDSSIGKKLGCCFPRIAASSITAGAVFFWYGYLTSLSLQIASVVTEHHGKNNGGPHPVDMKLLARFHASTACMIDDIVYLTTKIIIHSWWINFSHGIKTHQSSLLSYSQCQSQPPLYNSHKDIMLMRIPLLHNLLPWTNCLYTRTSADSTLALKFWLYSVISEFEDCPRTMLLFTFFWLTQCRFHNLADEIIASCYVIAAKILACISNVFRRDDIRWISG